MGTVVDSRAHIENISKTLLQIFSLSDRQNLSTVDVAEQMAEAKFKNTIVVEKVA
jgi:hypothetical protein